MKKKDFIYLILFLLGIVFLSYSYWVISLFIILFLTLFCLLHKESRFLSGNIVAFLIGFMLYNYLNSKLEPFFLNDYTRILVNRCLLVIILISCLLIAFICNKPLLKGFNKPVWNNRIYFPYISKGKYSIKVSSFLVQAISINIFVFLPIILICIDDISLPLVGFAILFSLINGILEEMIWRGVLFHTFRDYLNKTVYAVVFTSIGFGLQHISLGFPLLPSLLLSIGGIWFAIVDIRSDSVYPSIIWHCIINIGMVLSGAII